MSESILLKQISEADLKNLIHSAVQTAVTSVIGEPNKESNKERLLSRKEVCAVFKISETTLWHWQNAGKLRVYGVGARRFFKEHEIMEALTSSQR